MIGLKTIGMHSNNRTYTHLFIAMIGFITILVSCGIYAVVNHKPMPDKVITLSGGTFDIDVTVIVTSDTSIALRYVRENLDPNATSEDFDARAVTFQTIDGKPPIVWLSDTDDMSIINHELMHASIDVLRWAGINFTDDTEEAFAYELQLLTDQFYKRIQ